VDNADALTRALRDFDIETVRRLVADGADINARDERGDPFLFAALFWTSPYDEVTRADGTRYEVIASLIDLGADPRQLGEESESILTGPIFSQDAAMVELLLSRGVDPNRGCGECFETLYDLAAFDYRFEAWIQSGQTAPALPEDLGPDDEDRWIDFADQHALAKGLIRPEVLKVLRRHGALTGREMARKLGGDGSERIVWRDDRWQLDLDDR
jgi:ankyrin repeat protein